MLISMTQPVSAYAVNTESPASAAKRALKSVTVPPSGHGEDIRHNQGETALAAGFTATPI
jgi:hypothetical protein